MYKALFLLLIVSFFIFSCKKDSFTRNSNAIITVSADSVSFDTLFTSSGSVTKQLRINNQNNQKILLSDISLMGGKQSPFIINIDGSPATAVNNIEIAANDSLYLFISVYINPNTEDLPFILRDSIRISYNGNTRYIQLLAWGQNAHFLKNAIIEGNVNWTNDLPYVISGGLSIDTNATLSIQQGCRIYLHADAAVIVDGTLHVTGNAAENERVYFTGDRLDDPYNGFPASWPGIYFRTTSRDNLMNYAVIRNAYQAIAVEDPPVNGNPKLIINQCIVDNAGNAGIIGLNSSIQATNCLISNCGTNIEIADGGDYSFTHCTAASFSNNYIQHLQPVLIVSNYSISGTRILANDLNISFVNSIFWGANGNVDDEALIAKQGSTVFNIAFENCILKQKNYPAGIDSSSLFLNQDPLFTTVDNLKRLYDFHLLQDSPGIDRGKDAGITVDLDGDTRPAAMPDLGCYEKH